MKPSLRQGDCCVVSPLTGRKKEIYLHWKVLDFCSLGLRTENKAVSFVELDSTDSRPFHYRLELQQEDEEVDRFIFKRLKGPPFKYNGFWANEVYVDRLDKVEFDYHVLSFFDAKHFSQKENPFCHPVLKMENLLKSDLSILIEGETGTGKSYLAKAIHEKSGRQGEFVGVNLSSYSISLLESELFGHRKGAFTGALETKIGAFEMAQEGTLFLDEIDSLPIEIQTKLLTFLDNKVYRMVGDIKEKKLKTRLIFASGRALDQLVNRGDFRKDFFYRLKSGYSLKMNSLREEPGLIKNACKYFSIKHDLKLSKELQDFYMTLPWPGNLRQLFSHLEKKRILQKGKLMSFDEFDEELIIGSSDLSAFDAFETLSLEDYKLAYFSKVFYYCHKNIRLTARKLRISEKTVRRLLDKTNWQEHK